MKDAEKEVCLGLVRGLLLYEKSGYNDLHAALSQHQKIERHKHSQTRKIKTERLLGCVVNRRRREGKEYL
jgi:hypothetical protein